MTYGLRAWDASGVLTFDSTVDLTIFPKTEQFISGNNQVGSGSGMTISYPQFVGKKIMPFMTSPYGDYVPSTNPRGEPSGASVLSCRVSYPNGIPTVNIFVDDNHNVITGQNMPIFDGYLVVMLTGANQ